MCSAVGKIFRVGLGNEQRFVRSLKSKGSPLIPAMGTNATNQQPHVLRRERMHDMVSPKWLLRH